jgi:DNA-binding response OmpR family regulator
MRHIVICTEDTLLSDALAALLLSELGAEITQLAAPENLGKFAPTAIDLVIAHTSLGRAWEDKLLLLPKGAPRRIHDLLAEIHGRLGQKPPALVPLSASLTLDTASRRLIHNDTGSIVELTEKEQALLLFIKESGDARREDILAAVWTMAAEADSHTLETHIYRLRQKWRECADFDCIIGTDKGYRWYA